MFEDQLVPESSPMNGGRPVNWECQHQCVKTCDVLPTSEEWKTCEKMIRKSLLVTVTKVIRIQNKWLWEAYKFNKSRIFKRNHGIINEKVLFHGSSGNDPLEIACGEDGFDIRRSRGGSWGYAVYLSECAEYCDKFAFHNASNEKAIIVATALIGESFDFGTLKNKELRMPPVKDKINQCKICPI